MDGMGIAVFLVSSPSGQPQKGSFIMRFLLAALILIAGGVKANPVDVLKAGEWYEVPNSHMSAVDPCPANNCAYTGTNGQQSVMGAWGGGAFDSKRDRLICWGGGHGNYGGNEVYAFSLDSLNWRRLTDPSSIAGYNSSTHGILPDGRPVSTHTYDQLAYMPGRDLMFASSPASWPVADGGDLHSWLFNFSSNTWQLGASVPGSSSSPYGNAAVCDPVTGHVWYKVVGGSGHLYEYDPAKDSWTDHNGTAQSIWLDGITAAVDPVDRIMVAIGEGFFGVWQLGSSSNILYTTPATTGDASRVQSSAPGFAWDPVSNVFVSWSGGANVYTLDPKSWQWTVRAPAAGNMVIPTAPQSTGTFGRFQYCSSRNIFVVVNDNAQNVFVYKLDNNAGTAAEIGKTAVPLDLTVSPNPFRSRTCVSFSNPGRNAEVSIHDVSGRLVKSFKNVETSFVMFDGGNLTNGLYILKVRIGNESTMRKVLVQK